MGKGPFSFRRSSTRRRRPKSTTVPQPPTPTPPPPPAGAASSSSPPPPSAGNLIGGGGGGGAVGAAGKGKKKAAGAKLWMRFDTMGISELVEYDKSTIIERASIPARDLRILGPVFSHSSTILGMFKLKLLCSLFKFIKELLF